MSLVIKFYLTSSMLSMFWTLIHPSSGACDFSIVSPHWLCVNTSIIRSLRLLYRITTLVVCSCFDVCWSFGVVGWGGIRVAG